MSCPQWCDEPDCQLAYGAHPWSFSVAAAALPTRGGSRQVERINEKEKQWDRDMPAYKTMRGQGLQPPRIDGAADLAARATDDLEISYGKPISTKGKRDTAKSLLEDMAA